MQQSDNTISLITYNIHKGFGVGKVRFLLPQMKTAIAQLNPDFVFLQEVQGEHRRRKNALTPGLMRLSSSTSPKKFGLIIFTPKMQFITPVIMVMRF